MPLVLASCGTRLGDDELGLGDGGTSTVVEATGADTAPDVATSTTTATGPATVTDPSGTAATTAPQSSGAAATGSGDTGAATATGSKPSGSGPVTGAAGGLGPCTKVLDPILLGQNGTFSGFLQGSLGGFRPGMAAWAADVNARGGIQCHPVKLFQVDDGSNPAKTVSNTKDLIENKKVVAMVGAVVPFNITSYLSIVEPAKIPTLGGDNVDLGWDQSQYMFPTGVTVLPGMALGMKSSAERTGKRKFAVVYCVEASACASVHQASTELAKQAGVEIVNQQSISLTQTDYTSNCQTAKNAGADSVLAVFDSSALQRFFRSCAAIGYFPPSATIGLAVGASAVADPNVQKSTVTVTPTNAPYFNTFTPGVAEFQRVMKRFAPGAVLDNSSMSAFASGKLLEAALGKVASEARSGPVTTALILKGLHSLKNERLDGLSATPITYKAGQPNKLPPCAFVTVVQSGGIVDPLKGKSVCLGGAQAQSAESNASPGSTSQIPASDLAPADMRWASSVPQQRQRRAG